MIYRYVLAGCVAFGCLASARAADVPKFEMQEICTDLTIGYAVITADINGDGKPDIKLASE